MAVCNDPRDKDTGVGVTETQVHSFVLVSEGKTSLISEGLCFQHSPEQNSLVVVPVSDIAP